MKGCVLKRLTSHNVAGEKLSWWILTLLDLSTAS